MQERVRNARPSETAHENDETVRFSEMQSLWKILWEREAVLASQEQEVKLCSSEMRGLSDGVYKQETVPAPQRTEKDLQETNVDLRELQ